MYEFVAFGLCGANVIDRASFLMKIGTTNDLFGENVTTALLLVTFPSKDRSILTGESVTNFGSGLEP